MAILPLAALPLLLASTEVQAFPRDPAGFAFRDEGRRWRLGLEYYDGRVPIAEFFADDLRHFALGLFFDLGGH